MITIDFETRSKLKLSGKDSVDLRTYASHESTDVLCLAIKAEKVWVWVPQAHRHKLLPDAGVNLIEDFELRELTHRMINEGFEAHNVGFELEMWHFVMSGKYHFPDLSLWSANDSMAKCMAAGIPPSLEKAAEALGLTEQKDMEGSKIMKRLCAPVKVTKKNPTGFDEDPEKFTRLVQYCVQDVTVEHALSNALPPLRKSELWLMRHTLMINRDGIPIDRDAVSRICNIVSSHKEVLDMRMRALTAGVVESTSAREQVRAYLGSRGLVLESMRADIVDSTLAGRLDPHCRQVLQCYSDGAKTSVAKYPNMLSSSEADGSIHNFMVYHKAITGRFASRGCQVHNMPRTSKGFDIEDTLEDVRRGYKWFEQFNSDVLGTLSQAVRGCIHATPGETFVCYDFSAIEGRVLAWLARENHILKAYAEGLDTYKIAAASVFSNYTYDTITSDLRQIGKVIELACGYQGSVGAYVSMEKNYGIDTVKLLGDDIVEAKRKELHRKLKEEPTDEELKDELIKDLVYTWRKDRPRTVNFWYRLEAAALEALKHPGEYIDVERVSLRYEDEGVIPWLVVYLPSGRTIRYPKAKIVKKTVFGKVKDVVEYKKVDVQSGRWLTGTLYGGLMAENITQAVARDFLTAGFPALEDAGIPICFHVHDEVVASVREEEAEEAAKLMEELMTTLPKWVDGFFPLKAEGWVGKRYRK